MGGTGEGWARYGRVAASLHWVIAALLGVQLALGFAFHSMARGSVRSELFAWHKSLGVAILVVAVARIGWRLAHPPRALAEDMPRWRRRSAAGVHGTLYLLSVALPLSGLIAVSGYADTGVVTLVGEVALPEIPGISAEVGEMFEQFHKLFVTLTIWLIAAHVAAALWHRIKRR